MTSNRELPTLIESRQPQAVLDPLLHWTDSANSAPDNNLPEVHDIRRGGMHRTFSMNQHRRPLMRMSESQPMPLRRSSYAGTISNSQQPREFVVDVEATMKELLEREDTDGDKHISIMDSGPKLIRLRTTESFGSKDAEIRGTYMLSNLLQELALAAERGEKQLIISEARIAEDPIHRLSRMIRETFWDNLTRRIDADGLEKVLSDPKNRSACRTQIIYVPADEHEMVEYYRRVAVERPALRLEVEVLPKQLTPEYVRDLNKRPGLLAIAMKRRIDPDNGLVDMHGIPFVVPGARFNELYNWDSYFIALGLLADGRVDLAKGAVDHFIFEIKHYHKIMNGNRTYYLLRSQPPFFTDFIRRVYERLRPEPLDEHISEGDRAAHAASLAESREWLRGALRAAIKEYHTVWMSEPRYDPVTGLSRYHPEGLGVPPETEGTHFTGLLRPYAEKYGCSINEFTQKYNMRQVDEPELDEYFRHDRAVRESGHDTSYRLERRCANLATIDLQALLYKYEVDIAELLRDEFNDHLELEEDFFLAPCGGRNNDAPQRSIDTPQCSAEWFERAAFRQQQVNKYCWNEGRSLYFDYDLVEGEQSLYESVTSFWTLWASLATPQQAKRMVQCSLQKFEVTGGLVPGTEESRGPVSLARPNRQWDYPFAWPPHQMLAWVGLERYGFMDDARRLAYRWMYLMTTAFVDFNGVVPEKFDAVSLSHLVNAEYGNQGLDFAYVPREGFGWMNASFQVGQTFLTDHMRKAVNACQHPDDYFGCRRDSIWDGNTMRLSRSMRRPRR